ncbi:protein misato-like [Agrilus planipennis]|uniref:Protein misato-like n=1 Tax=Agrilus planipennis TaxID=224129 RepID=A0A1W4XRC1_AGRPL|nr:protein misato-like [Agrilus planipennis]
MSGKEVVTLQFGHYSNFVGAHLWNLNDLSFDYSSNQPSKINHDVLYREGLTNDGHTTFTPRALLVDLKGSLKYLSKDGSLYSERPAPEKVDIHWDKSRIEIKKDFEQSGSKFIQEIEKGNGNKVLNKKQNLEQTVNVWSDFLYTRYHPRTVNIINEYKHEDVNKEFDVYPLGVNLWNNSEFSEEFSDKIRNYIEECDNFQGFHVILDAVDAFSGLSTSCIEHVRDEYEKKSVMAIPLIPSYYKDYNITSTDQNYKSITKDSVRVLNIALCFNDLAENASIFVPLCTGLTGWRQPGESIPFNNLHYDSRLWYHSSAILASAIDTFTLKHRLRSYNFSLNDLCADLSSFGRRAVASSLCLPFSFNKDATLLECLDNWDGPLSKSITPNCKIGSNRMMQYWFLRGIAENRLKHSQNQQNLPAFKCNTVQEMLTYYMACTTYASANNVTVVDKALTVKTPYPDIFNAHVGIDGNIIADMRPEDSGKLFKYNLP